MDTNLTRPQFDVPLNRARKLAGWMSIVGVSFITLSAWNVGSASAKTPATAAIEKAIVSTLSGKSPSPIKAVNCPDLEKLEGGKTFDCTLTIAEGTFPATVTLKDDSGNFLVKTKNILVRSALENQLVARIKQDNKVDVKAECGSSKVRFFKKVGETFTCKLTQTDGRVGTATITVTSLWGGVDARWSIAR